MGFIHISNMLELCLSVTSDGVTVSHLRTIKFDCFFWPHVKWSCNLFPAEDTAVDHPAKKENSLIPAAVEKVQNMTTCTAASDERAALHHWKRGRQVAQSIWMWLVLFFFWYAYTLSQVIHGYSYSWAKALPWWFVASSHLCERC